MKESNNDPPIFCVAEKKRPYYFASNGDYFKDAGPIPIRGFTLWANLHALDTITTPATVVVTKLKDSIAFLYRVKFSSSTPDLYEKMVSDGLSIFYTPSDSFLRLDSTHPCVPIPNNNWENNSFRFHALAAFYRLNVIPSLSMPLFEREDLFDDVCNDFYEKYHFNPPLNEALSSIFCKLFYSLKFFGFTSPSNLTEQDSLVAVEKLVHSFVNKKWGSGNTSKQPSSKLSKRQKRHSFLGASTSNFNEENTLDPENDFEIDANEDIQNNRFFAFAEIKYAIAKYHNECYPWRSETLPPDILDYTSYCNLIQAVERVRNTLITLKMLPDDAYSLQEALRKGIFKFQDVNHLPTTGGQCDLFTMRRIWNASQTNGCDLLALCRLSGLKTIDPEVPVFTHTLSELHSSLSKNPKLKTPQNSKNSQQNQIEQVMNEVLGRVRDRNESQQLIVQEATNSVQSQIARIDKASETAKDIQQMIDSIVTRLESAQSRGEIATRKFEEASDIIEEIIEENSKLKKEFDLIHKRIEEERNGNKILMFLIAFLFVVIMYKFLKTSQ